MSKHNKRNRGHHGVNLLPGKGKLAQAKVDHKAQTKSPGQEAQAQAKASKQEQEAQEQEAQTKAGLTVDTDAKTGQTAVKDAKGQPVLTKTDKAKIDKAKASQTKAREARRLALEAQREAKEALEDLSNGGSGAIKALKQELEAKVKAQEAKVEAKLTEHKAELATLNELYAEYKSLTGLDKASQGKSKAKGQSKGQAPNDNGRFRATVKGQDGVIRVLVTNIETASLFETSLAPVNGTVKLDDWHALRHRFIAHFESPDTKRKVDRALPARDYNLVLRAYLSNLKGKVEAVKPIA